MTPYLAVLFLAPPLLAIAYATLEHFKIFDRLTGRDRAMEALERLRSGSGYPRSWIYDDAEDKLCFIQLEKRISKKTRSEKLKAVLRDGTRPSLIAVGGEPMILKGVPGNWDATEQRVYLSGHPILYVFGVSRSGGKGKGDRACSLGDLEKWLNDEKENRKFLVGAIALGIISLTFVVLRVLNGS